VLHTTMRFSGVADAKAVVRAEMGTGAVRWASLGVTGIPDASKGKGTTGPTKPWGAADESMPFLAFPMYLKP